MVLNNTAQVQAQTRLKGVYVYDLVIYPADGSHGPVPKQGTMEFDGLGNVVATTDSDSAGEVRRGNMNNLEYTFDPKDGKDPNTGGNSGSMILRWHVSSFPFGKIVDPNLAFQIVNEGMSLRVKQTNEAWNVSGTLTKQTVST